jgi:hypothetical protein
VDNLGGTRALAAALFAVLLVAVVAIAATVEPATAGAQGKGNKSGGSGRSSGAIRAPRPGAHVTGDSPRLIVNAGAERRDLKAKLNGVSIGPRFEVNWKQHRRFLAVSLVDGLRRGKNNLVVWVKQKSGKYRKSQVNFVVKHNRPMASAGRSVTVTEGSKIELHGQVLLPEATDTPAATASDASSGQPGPAASSGAEVAASGTEIEWSIVNGPEPTDLTAPLATLTPSNPSAPAKIEEANTLSPIFAPDLPGKYTLQMTAQGATGTSTDSIDIYVIPPTPLVTFNTEVKAGKNKAQPGVQIGSNLIAAPYMRTEGGVDNYSGTTQGGVEYKATVQVIAAERTTTAPLWNRTYGLCRKPGGSWYTCRITSEMGPEAGVPVAADLSQEISDLGVLQMVIVASHQGGGAGNEWTNPDEARFVEGNLAPLGFPKESDPEIGAAVTSAKPGEFAGIGIKGLKQGEATVQIGNGKIGMTGYLTPDSRTPAHYQYVSGEHVPFDTRASYSCSGGNCTVTQSIGTGPNATGASGSVASNRGGFLVAGYNRLTLQPIESKTFQTAYGPEEDEGNNGTPRLALEAMPGFLEGLQNKQALVMITSIHGNQQPSQKNVLYQLGTPSWGKVLPQIAKLGGTREAFIKGLSTNGGDYSLVGQIKQVEGASPEASTPGARVRGFLTPDNESIYKPEAANPATKPASLLLEEVLRKPGTEAWPDENSPEVQAAMSWIGNKTILGENPQVNFWKRVHTTTDAGTALTEVKGVKFEKGNGFRPAVFTKAQNDLLEELPMVERARSYINLLASPAGGGSEAWTTAFQLSAELTDLQTKLEAEAKAEASVFQFLSQVLQLVSPLLPGGEGIAATLKFVEQVATTSQLGVSIYNTLYNGGQGQPSQHVKATELAKNLTEQAQESQKSIERFGDILISDWSKLKVVGTYGRCVPPNGCGPNEKYKELSFPPEAEALSKKVSKEAAEREMYTQLVPLVFPIWKLEPLLQFPATDLHNHYYCYDVSYPLYYASQKSYARVPWSFIPNREYGSGPLTFYQVYATIRRDGLRYGHPTEKILEAMFNPREALHKSEVGLEMNQAEYMREGERVAKYIPSHGCEWY